MHALSVFFITVVFLLVAVSSAFFIFHQPTFFSMGLRVRLGHSRIALGAASYSLVHTLSRPRLFNNIMGEKGKTRMGMDGERGSGGFELGFKSLRLDEEGLGSIFGRQLLG